MSFEGQTVVITGASSGIGRALAQRLAEAGAKVGVTARRKAMLDELVDSIRRSGGRAIAAEADVTDRVGLHAAIRSIREQFGPVDLLIASAGVAWPSRIDHGNIDEMETVIRINVLGVMYAVEAVVGEMLERGRGHIAAVSSLASYKGFPGKAAYCASKAAVNAYMESLRISLRPRGIAVTTICPGFVATPMTEGAGFRMPWLMTADAAADRILRALKRRAKVYNFPWQTTLLVKACRWIPDWLFARWMKGGYGDEEVHGVVPVSEERSS